VGTLAASFSGTWTCGHQASFHSWADAVLAATADAPHTVHRLDARDMLVFLFSQLRRLSFLSHSVYTSYEASPRMTGFILTRDGTLAALSILDAQRLLRHTRLDVQDCALLAHCGYRSGPAATVAWFRALRDATTSFLPVHARKPSQRHRVAVLVPVARGLTCTSWGERRVQASLLGLLSSTVNPVGCLASRTLVQSGVVDTQVATTLAPVELGAHYAAGQLLVGGLGVGGLGVGGLGAEARGALWLSAGTDTQPVRTSTELRVEPLTINARLAGLESQFLLVDPTLYAWQWRWVSWLATLPLDKMFLGALTRRPMAPAWAPTRVGEVSALASQFQEAVRVSKEVSLRLVPSTTRLSVQPWYPEIGSSTLEAERFSLNPVFLCELPAPYLDVDPAYLLSRWTLGLTTTRRSNHAARYTTTWGPWVGASLQGQQLLGGADVPLSVGRGAQLLGGTPTAALLLSALAGDVVSLSQRAGALAGVTLQACELVGGLLRLQGGQLTPQAVLLGGLRARFTVPIGQSGSAAYPASRRVRGLAALLLAVQPVGALTSPWVVSWQPARPLGLGVGLTFAAEVRQGLILGCTQAAAQG
jgi:hypothetical protein